MQETKISISGFTFEEFLSKAQEAIRSGYSFDFLTNDHYPQRFGNTYECVMVLANQPAESIQEPIQVTEEVQANQALSVEESIQKPIQEISQEPVQEPAVSTRKKGKQ